MGARLDPWKAFRRHVGPRIGLFHMYTARPIRIPEPYADAGPPGSGASISLVTPVRNQAQFIGQALESVLSQRYPRLEYIVMDGASSDGTAEIIGGRRAELAHFRSAPDAGQADALDRGFALSSGEIMGWLNGDDFLLPGALAFVGAFFRDHPQVDLVYGDRVVVDESGRDVGRWVLPAHSDAVLSWVDFVPQETMFWRRSAWDRAGGRIDAGMRFAMDWELLLRLRAVGARMVHVPRFLGAFRVHSAQKTSAQIDDVGFGEMSGLRAAQLGYVPSRARMALAVLPYATRQVARDLAYRLTRRAVERCPLNGVAEVR